MPAPEFRISSPRSTLSPARATPPVRAPVGSAAVASARSLFSEATYRPEQGLAFVGKFGTPWGTSVEEELRGTRVAPRGAQSAHEYSARAGAQFERYLADGTGAEALSVPLYRLALSLQMVGRGAADRAGGSRRERLANNGRMLESIQSSLGLPAEDFRRLKALLTHDPLGPYLRSDAKAASLEMTVPALEKAAASAGMEPRSYFRATLPFYQACMAAYTKDAGLERPYFDDLFALRSSGALTFDPALGRLRMNPANETRLQALDAALSGLSRTPSAAGGPASSPAPSRSSPGRTSALSYIHEPSASDKEEALARLNPTQRRVVEAVRTSAAAQHDAAYRGLVRRAAGLGYSESDVRKVLSHIQSRSSMNIYFISPRKGLTDHVAAVNGFRREGRYINIFESGTGGGSMGTARRAEKENRLFNGLYHSAGFVPGDAPIYGALNAEGPGVVGAEKYYGEAYLDLKPEVSERTSICHRNSRTVSFPQLGTTSHFAHVLGNPELPDAYVRRIFRYALGELDAPREWLASAREELASTGGRYFEGQIHGPVDFRKDLARIVAQDKHAATPLAAHLRALASDFGVPLFWNCQGELVED